MRRAQQHCNTRSNASPDRNEIKVSNALDLLHALTIEASSSLPALRQTAHTDEAAGCLGELLLAGGSSEAGGSSKAGASSLAGASMVLREAKQLAKNVGLFCIFFLNCFVEGPLFFF
jgi:hypothetical protein